MSDSQYRTLPAISQGIDHLYGPRVHLMSNAYAMSMLTRACQPDAVQPEVNHLVSTLYDHLLGVVASSVLRRSNAHVPTRMAQYTDKGVYTGQYLDGERLLEYDEIAKYFGRFKHLTMMIGGSEQSWNIPCFDAAMSEIASHLAAHSIKLVVNPHRTYQDMAMATGKDGVSDYWHFRRHNHNIKKIIATINATFDLNVFLDIANAYPEHRPQPMGPKTDNAS